MNNSNENQLKPTDKTEEIFLTADEIKNIGCRLYDVLEIIKAQGRVYNVILEELDDIVVLLMEIDDEEGVAEHRSTSRFLKQS